MKSLKKLLLLILPLIAVGCSDNHDPGNDAQDNNGPKVQISRTDRQIGYINGDFAWDLYNETHKAKTDKNQNLSISPISANIALCMLANGANDDGRSKILSALGYPDNITVADVNSYLNKVVGYLTAEIDGTTVKFANSIWSKHPVSQDYEQAINSAYDAEIFAINPATLRDDINSWCAQQTDNLIPELYQTTPDFVFAILNATYFKSEWAPSHKFNKANTVTDTFHNSDGSVSSVDFMTNEIEANAGWNEKSAMCLLNFAHSSYTMGFILPDEGHTIDEVIDEMANGGWYDAYHENNLNTKLKIKLPKFEIADKTNLLTPLSNMGMKKVFGENIFTQITDDDLIINNIFQSLKLGINEDGAEAAAVTVIEGTGAPGALQSGVLTFDRPFLYFIMESQTEAVLFMGEINRL